jgi:hypothetical protein
MIIRVRNRQLLGALVGMVGLAILLVGVPYLAARAFALATNGAEATGTVTGKTTQDTSDPNAPTTGDTTAYHVAYTFTPPGSRPVAGDDVVDRDEWTTLAVGSPITIRYVSSDPGTNEIGSGPSSPLGYVAFALPISVGLLLTLMGGRLFLLARAEARLRARLLRVGVRAVGTVVNPKAAVAFFSSRPYQRLSYGYADQSGQAWTGLSDWLPIVVAHGWRVGAHGNVRYDPASPSQSYWFGSA